MPAALPPMTLDARHRRLRLDPRDDLFVQDPYAAFAAVRQAASAFFWEDYGFWCFASHAGVSALLRDRWFGRDVLHVASRAELGWPEPDPRLEPFLALERGSMLDLEPPQHTRLRGLVNRAFVSREVDRLAPRIAALAHDLIDRFPAAGVDLLPAFATPIPLTVIAELLGVPTEHGPDLLAWSHAMVGMYQFGRDADVEAAAVAASEAFTTFLGALVAERRRAPREDLLTRLVTAEVGGERLTDGEIVGTAVLLLNAGHEATVHAIGNGVKALIETGVRPAGGEQTAGVIEEVLRYDAPLHLFTRFALEDLTVDGIAFKRGDKIGLLLGAANRDPDRFPDPDAFRPERSPNPHVAFGAGIHFCLGAPLARLEMQVALPILFERLPGLALAAPPRFRDTYHFHGLEELRVAW
jgi:cytochrome P450